MSSWCISKGDTRIIINTHIYPQRIRERIRFKLLTVEISYEILCHTTSIRTTRINADKKNPFVLSVMT